MSLCNRLHTKPPIFAWGKYHFRYLGKLYESKSRLVWLVAERFARRFGAIDGKRADQLYDRLARRYCDRPGNVAVFNSLSHGHARRDHIAHPESVARHDRQERYLEFIKDQARLAVLQAVSQATSHPAGRYCDMASAGQPCRACNRPTTHDMVVNGEDRKIYRARNGVCLHTRCQALVELFPKAFNSRKYYQFPVLLILQEITKNATHHDHAHQRRLAQHFVRHTGQVRQRATRRHFSQDGRQTGR